MPSCLCSPIKVTALDQQQRPSRGSIRPSLHVSVSSCPVEEYSVGSATDLTETSSVVDGDWTMVDENASTLSLSQAELEHISMELANKGPHKSQVQLR